MKKKEHFVCLSRFNESFLTQNELQYFLEESEFLINKLKSPNWVQQKNCYKAGIKTKWL